MCLELEFDSDLSFRLVLCVWTESLSFAQILSSLFELEPRGSERRSAMLFRLCTVMAFVQGNWFDLDLSSLIGDIPGLLCMGGARGSREWET